MSSQGDIREQAMMELRDTQESLLAGVVAFFLGGVGFFIIDITGYLCPVASSSGEMGSCTCWLCTREEGGTLGQVEELCAVREASCDLRLWCWKLLVQMRLLRRDSPLGWLSVMQCCPAPVVGRALCCDGWRLQDSSANWCCSELFGELAPSLSPSPHMSIMKLCFGLADSHLCPGSTLLASRARKKVCLRTGKLPWSPGVFGLVLVRVHLLKQLLLFLLFDQPPVQQQGLPLPLSPARAARGFCLRFLDVQGIWGLLSCSSRRLPSPNLNPPLHVKQKL